MPPPPRPVDLAAVVLAGGRAGLARVEIATGLGMTVEALEGRAEDDAALAEALALADEAAEAWWLALPRQLLEAGRGMNAGVWRASMDWRFGEASAAAASCEPAAPPEQRVILYLPKNGREWRPPRAAPARPRKKTSG